MSVQKLNDPWRAYHRFVFRICAAHLSPSDSLVEFAVTVAEAEELSRCASHILTRSEHLKLPPYARAELESIAPAADNAGQDAAAAPAPLHLRRIFKRVARHNDAIKPVIIDCVKNPEACPPLPPIAHEVAQVFSLSATEMQILIALFTWTDLELAPNIMRDLTHRTQMNIIAEAAHTDLATFVKETAPGKPMERFGLISYRGGRDEIADIEVSRPLLFALRSDTVDDLKAGLFDETPEPQFTLLEFSLPGD